MMFISEIIEESLIDPAMLDGIRPWLIKTRTATVENFTPSLWHVNRYRLPREQVLPLTERLAGNISNGSWYVHFYAEEADEMYVVLSGRVFRLPKHRDPSWDEMIAYGESVGVGQRWTGSIPVDFAD